MSTQSAHRFDNRVEAGRELAQRLRAYRGRDDVVVPALPRGGVPGGSELPETYRWGV